MRVSKSYFLQLVLVLIVCKTAISQENIILGVGPSLELEENILGANIRTYYGLNERFCFGPEVSYFPHQDINDEYQLSIVDLNFNAHYIFEISHKIGVYPLSGLNYTIEKERLIEDNDEDEQVDEFGLNYGLGVHYNLGNFYVFGEFKGIAGQLNDQFLTAGVIFSLKRFEKESHHHKSDGNND